MKVEPLYDRLLVRPIDGGNKTRGGLYIPDMAVNGTPYTRAEVIAAGTGRIATTGQVVPLSVQPGDIVVFFRNASGGEQIVFPDEDGTDLLIIRESHVALILRDLPRATGLIGNDGEEILVQ
jgi:chaperonin GroES